MSVINPANETLFDISVTGTAWNASGFLTTGLEVLNVITQFTKHLIQNIVHGILESKVPSFHSGTAEQFRR